MPGSNLIQESDFSEISGGGVLIRTDLVGFAQNDDVGIYYLICHPEASSTKEP